MDGNLLSLIQENKAHSNIHGWATAYWWCSSVCTLTKRTLQLSRCSSKHTKKGWVALSTSPRKGVSSAQLGLPYCGSFLKLPQRRPRKCWPLLKSQNSPHRVGKHWWKDAASSKQHRCSLRSPKKMGIPRLWHQIKHQINAVFSSCNYNVAVWSRDMGNILKTYKIAPVIYYQSRCRKILGIKFDGRRSNITLSFSVAPPVSQQRQLSNHFAGGGMSWGCPTPGSQSKL